MISARLGQGEKDKARSIFSLSVLCTAVMGLLICVLGNIRIHPLAELLGSTPAIHEEAISYMWYILTFSPFLLFSFLLSGLVRNDNRPKLAMFALMFGSVSNIVLDYVFMYPMNMGIAGAALATALGPIFSVLIMLPHFLFKRGDLYLAKFKLRWSNLCSVYVLGFPSFIMEFTIGIITFVYNFAIVHYGFGEIGLAAYLVIGYLMLIILTLFLGMAQGLQPVFSYFMGTGEKARSRALLGFSVKMFLAIGILCYILIVFFSRYFFSIFNPGDIELIDLMESKSLPYFCGFFLAGFNILMISYWQANERTGKALAVSLSRSVIWPPVLIAVLPLLFGSEAIWFCHSASEMLTAVTAIILLILIRHRERESRGISFKEECL